MLVLTVTASSLIQFVAIGSILYNFTWCRTENIIVSSKLILLSSCLSWAGSDKHVKWIWERERKQKSLWILSGFGFVPSISVWCLRPSEHMTVSTEDHSLSGSPMLSGCQLYPPYYMEIFSAHCERQGCFLSERRRAKWVSALCTRAWHTHTHHLSLSQSLSLLPLSF